MAHPKSVAAIEEGDEVVTYARIEAQGIRIPMPRCKVDRTIDEGDILQIGDQTLAVWSTPGHTAGQLALRLDNLLFSGDNIFRDGTVGVIDAHHGSNLLEYISSLKRILAADVDFLLPSHGPIFRKDNRLIEATIARLDGYSHMADFGTCAVDWPLMDEWEEELRAATSIFEGTLYVDGLAYKLHFGRCSPAARPNIMRWLVRITRPAPSSLPFRQIARAERRAGIQIISIDFGGDSGPKG